MKLIAGKRYSFYPMQPPKKETPYSGIFTGNYDRHGLAIVIDNFNIEWHLSPKSLFIKKERN